MCGGRGCDPWRGGGAGGTGSESSRSLLPSYGIGGDSVSNCGVSRTKGFYLSIPLSRTMDSLTSPN